MHVTFTLMPAASTSAVSVQVSGFEDNGLLTHCDRLICDFCSSSQCFACGFLQIPPHDGHPCRPANRSPCRVDRGLSPPSHPSATMRFGTAPVVRRYAPCLAHHKKTASSIYLKRFQGFGGDGGNRTHVRQPYTHRRLHA